MMECAFCHGNEGTLALLPTYGNNLYCTPCRREFYPQGWELPDDKVARAERLTDREEKDIWW